MYYDHREGRMLIPPMVTMQEVMEEMFDERATNMTTAEGRVFVMAKWQGYVLCLVDGSAVPDDLIFLRAQLYAIFRLMVLVFGPNALRTRQSPFFLRHRKQLQRLFDLSAHYFGTDQSFLVRAPEQVDVNRDLARQCRLELQKVLKTLPSASHALLFAGTKLLASFSKPDWAELHVQDLFSLLLYSRSLFHPIERELDTDEPPVADYSDHAAASVAPESDATDEAAAVNTSFPAPEATDVAEISLDVDEGPSLKLPALATAASLAEMLDLVLRAAASAPAPAAGPSARTAFDWSGDKSAVAGELAAQLGGGGLLASESVAVLQYALWRLSMCDAVDGVAGPALSSCVVAFQESAGVPPTGTMDRATLSRLAAKLAGPAVGGGEAARAAPVTCSLHLRTRRLGKGSGVAAGSSGNAAEEPHSLCRVHFAELDEPLSLVIVGGGRPEADEEAKLARIVGYLRSRKSLGSYLSFFAAKERAPLSVLSYVHQFPGLVHFIAVDRTLHRLLAPSLSELYGQHFAGRGEAVAAQQREMLRQHVWHMCSLSHQLLATGGHSSSLVRRGDFVYYYQLWVEEDGHLLPFDGPLAGAGELVHDTNAYASLVARSFPDRKNLRCFELYGLFLASLAAPTLKKYVELLLDHLRQNFPLFFQKQ